MKKISLASSVIGATLLGVASVGAYAAQNPFAVQELSSGYSVAAAEKAKEGSYDEAKCGADRGKHEASRVGHEGSRGADRKAKEGSRDGEKKAGEGNCGVDRKKPQGLRRRTMQREFVSGAGLNLCRALLEPLDAGDGVRVDFLEVTPENWIGIDGRLSRQFRELTERLPFLRHGLSLNLGGYVSLDMSLLRAIKGFIEQHDIRVYSEHLSVCADDDQLYDLVSLPFSDESVRRVAERVRVIQDVLERPLIVENVSTYVRLPGELEEVDFVRAVLEEADCQLPLDVNNVYVNAYNFGFNAHAYIAAMSSRRIAYLHMAGHDEQGASLKIDTHGVPICDPVWELLAHAYTCHGERLTLLGRDFNLPPLSELYAETDRIRELQRRSGGAQLRSLGYGT